MRCSKCGTGNPDGAKFCVECASPFARRCASCGAENPPTAKYCLECSKPLDKAGPESPRLGQPVKPPIRLSDRHVDDSLDGERKTVTALFADIKGSTELEQDLDPEEARAIVDPALKLMINAVRHYDGYIVQSTGDGIFALFGAPVAHEDHPQRALHAALRMQSELQRYSAKLVAEGGTPIEARIGANTGEVVVRSIATGEGHTEYTPIGHTANLASRMQAVAPTGSIAVSESTRRLVQGYFTLKSRGPAKVKGLSEPVNVYVVTGLGPLRSRLQRSASRGYTRFVGREREVEALRHAAELARDGHGQIVAAIAEPGVGKSRLFYEFKVTSQSGWLVLEALSVSHGKATAYLPLIELLHDYFGIEEDDEPRRRREKVAGKVTMLDRSLEEEALPHLFALLGIVEGEDPFAQMDAQIRRRRTQDAVKRILLRESLNQPLMLIFEDLHWIDEETQGFLNLLAEGMANAPVLLLVNYRPEYTHQWGSKTYYTQLRLDPLGKESADQMLAGLLGDDAQLAPLKRLITEKTAGNPLFIEELVGALFDEGVLVRNGVVKLTRPPNQLKIPPTVQGILAARIDRLPAEEKELLQTLAVIGIEFPFSLVREVVQLPAERLGHVLSGLQTGEFIYEQPAAGDAEYTFKHALTHDVAYNSLLAERRKLLHERTAQAIEALYHERPEDHYADLAHHYRLSNNATKAVEYLRLAGEQAVGRGAYAQALANVEPALRLVERLPAGGERLRAELGVRLVQGSTVAVLYGMASAERLNTFERVCELSERLGDESAEIQGKMGVAATYLNTDLSLALRISRQCVDLVQRSPGGELRPIVHLQLSVLLHNAGDPIQAYSLLSDLMTHFDPARQEAGTEYLPVNAWVLTPIAFSWVQHTLGRLDEAVKLSEQALWRARQLKRPFNLGTAYTLAAILRYLRREPDVAREMAEAVIAVAEKHGFGQSMALGQSVRGWALAASGQPEKGIAELEANAPSLIPSSFQMQVLGMLAEAYLRAGRADQATGTLDEALAKSERSGVRIHEPELYRLKGDTILMRDSSAVAQAEECFRKAIEVARGQSAKWWELRATVSLAQLLRDTGHRDQARAMLAEIYNWFTEGFDTADLKEAKVLLDELGG